jgi:eukaryotic-like serine/threonine-protein kinase
VSILVDRLQEVLSDRYRFERELGHGGVAVVLLAWDVRHERPVAIKVFRSDVGDADAAKRFQREIRLLARLQHPHILPLYDSGTAGETSYFVTAFVEGESLRERLRRESELPIDEAVRLAVEVADALDFAHQHDVIHRDIKPENILLHDGHAVVADFGIARMMRRRGAEWTTSAGMAVGSPAYMSPEQASGEREIDGRSDIYSLASVLYETLAGRPPFTGPSAHSVIAQRMTTDPRPVRDLRGTVPPALDAAVAKALARAPGNRFATAADFGAALGRSLPGSGAPERRRWWPFARSASNRDDA